MNKKFIFFSKLSLILVLFVILAGSLVRMTGSGMGCPDWPKCFGYLIPPTSIEEITWKPNQSYDEGVMILHENKFFNSKQKFTSNKSFELYNWIPYTKHDYTKFDPLNTWFEFVNRLIGAIAGFSTLIMFFLSTYEFKRNKILTLLSGLVVLSMGFQAWLGKLVVDSNLSPYKISIHMIMAIVIVCLIIYIIKKADAKY
jgi:cytochrome c oxidase assembly protein subunit 15